MYEVVIVGDSFASLATALQPRGHGVLLLDQYPIGARQMSARATPLAIGAAAAVS
jgi:glycine/D-amino acid oxidase-like deaminating enzyme